MTGNLISRALFFWPGALLIRFGQWLLLLSDTHIGRFTLRPLFRLFCRFALYARPYLLRGPRTNNVTTLPQLDALILRHRLIAAIPCACRAGRSQCTVSHHGEHELNVCLSFGLAAVVQIGSGLGKRLTREMAKELCQRGAESGLVHHAIYSFGSLFEVCNCCSETCSVVRAYKAGVPEAVRPSEFRAVRGVECNGCGDRESRVCEEVCPYGHHPSSNECLGCEHCVDACPHGAVSMVLRRTPIAKTKTSLSRAMAAANRDGQFSLRDLFIAIAAVASMFGGFSLYGVTGVTVAVAVLGRYLMCRGEYLDKEWVFGMGGWLWASSVVVLLFMALGWVFGGIGPLLPWHSSPHGLLHMVEMADADAKDVNVAGLGGGFLDHEYVWRVPVTCDKLAAIINDYGLVEVQPTDVAPRFRRNFPPWWRPWHRKNSRYLATPDFPSDSRGPDGIHIFVMYDPGKERLYVWCKSNF